MGTQQLKKQKGKNVGINWIPLSSRIQIKKRSGNEQVSTVVVVKTLVKTHTHGCKQRKCSERASFYTLVGKTGLKPVLMGTMSDLQEMGGEFLSCVGERGVGVSPS